LLEENDSIDIDGANRVILLVDDELQQREVICDLFDGYGFDSVAAADGAAALDILHHRHVDLILTDQYMPGIDGWALLRAVRCDYPDLPVVLYSSAPPRPSVADAVVAFDATVLKPASGTTLVRQVERLLRPAQQGT